MSEIHEESESKVFNHPQSITINNFIYNFKDEFQK